MYGGTKSLCGTWGRESSRFCLSDCSSPGNCILCTVSADSQLQSASVHRGTTYNTETCTMQPLFLYLTVQLCCNNEKKTMYWLQNKKHAVFLNKLYQQSFFLFLHKCNTKRKHFIYILINAKFDNIEVKMQKC